MGSEQSRRYFLKVQGSGYHLIDDWQWKGVAENILGFLKHLGNISVGGR